MAGKRDRRVAEAVDAAEDYTGLQLCVYLGPAPEDTRALAERLFVSAEAEGQRPAVLIAVGTKEHRVEILTADWVRARIPDEACQEAIERMTPALRRRAYDQALVEAVQALAAVAGPGEAPDGDVELPDVFDER